MDAISFYQTIPQLGIKGRIDTPSEFDLIGLPKTLTESQCVILVAILAVTFLNATTEMQMNLSVLNQMTGGGGLHLEYFSKIPIIRCCIRITKHY